MPTASSLLDPQRGIPHQVRVRDVRQMLPRVGIDALLVPSGDEHLGEFVAPYARRLAWLSGFEGSAGTAAVTATDAALFVDGRYSLQVLQETDALLWQYEDSLGFEILSWAPFDRALIEASLLDATERQWLDGYHADVLREIGRRLPSDVTTWLEQACRPITLGE